MDSLYLCYMALGAGLLMPWCAFITAADYYAERYPGAHTHVDRLVTVSYLPINILVLVAFIHNHERVNPRKRIVLGFVAFTFAMLAMPLIDFLPAGKVTLAATLTLVALCGAADGAAQGALFGEAATLDGRFTQALVAGTAFSGLIVSLMRILTKLALPATASGLQASSNVYFISAAMACAACTAIYMRIAKINGNRVHQLTTAARFGGPQPEWPDSEAGSVADAAWKRPLTATSNENMALISPGTIPSSPVPFEEDLPAPSRSYLEVAWHVRSLALSLIFVYVVTLAIFPGVLAEDVASEELGSWYPVILMAVFNAADCAGKWTPASLRLESVKAIAVWAGARTLFIPAFHFAAVGGAGGVVIGTCAALLGLTNGWLTTSAMVLGPSQVGPREANLCGNIMVLSLVGGLCIGAACGFLWLL